MAEKKLRKNAWTEEQDLTLVGAVLSHLRKGNPLTDAFKEASEIIGKSPAACGFHWNNALKGKYETTVEEIKLQNQIAKETNIELTEEERAQRKEAMNEKFGKYVSSNPSNNIENKEDFDKGKPLKTSQPAMLADTNNMQIDQPMGLIEPPPVVDIEQGVPTSPPFQPPFEEMPLPPFQDLPTTQTTIFDEPPYFKTKPTADVTNLTGKMTLAEAKEKLNRLYYDLYWLDTVLDKGTREFRRIYLEEAPEDVAKVLRTMFFEKDRQYKELKEAIRVAEEEVKIVEL